jgi:hypothetical protein
LPHIGHGPLLVVDHFPEIQVTRYLIHFSVPHCPEQTPRLLSMSKSGAAVFCLFILIAGCGGAADDKWTKDRPKTFQVSGTVSLNGTPVAGATVNFISVDGKSSPFGVTDTSGRFRLTTFDQHDGAPLGNYKVTITKKTVETKPHPKEPETQPAIVVKTTWDVPENYSVAAKSGLEAQVTDGGKNEFTFDLK